MDRDGAFSAVIDWVILTRGDRPTELRDAIRSLRTQPSCGDIWVIVNGTVNGLAPPAPAAAEFVVLRDNIGVPAGRDTGLRYTKSELVGFLDDDAELLSADAFDRIRRAFADDPQLGVISCRLTDDQGQTARRHVPRIGRSSSAESGAVVNFLGGACVMRRSAYEVSGGYWGALFYGHEELDLAWRLAEHGFGVRYDADVVVYHPRTEISRHADGWRNTGRNRVLVARRNLPWPVAAVHVLTWLVLGVVRAPGSSCRRGYLAGWWKGWRMPVERMPISWRTVARLSRLGRPPIV